MTNVFISHFLFMSKEKNIINHDMVIQRNGGVVRGVPVSPETASFEEKLYIRKSQIECPRIRKRLKNCEELILKVAGKVVYSDSGEFKVHGTSFEYLGIFSKNTFRQRAGMPGLKSAEKKMAKHVKFLEFTGYQLAVAQVNLQTGSRRKYE